MDGCIYPPNVHRHIAGQHSVCSKQSGLQVYGWVIMLNHFHAILSCRGEFKLSNVLRDMKKFTSTQITNAIRDNVQESLRSWLLWLLRNEKGTGISFGKKEIIPKKYGGRSFSCRR